MTETHFPSTKIEVTDRGDVLMPTNFSQLDDEPKKTAAGESDATKYSFDVARLVELVSVLSWRDLIHANYFCESYLCKGCTYNDFDIIFILWDWVSILWLLDLIIH